MGFRVSGLDYGEFEPLFALTDAQLAQKHIVRRVADKKPGCFAARVDRAPTTADRA